MQHFHKHESLFEKIKFAEEVSREKMLRAE
jgi:hypothetical protein